MEIEKRALGIFLILLSFVLFGRGLEAELKRRWMFLREVWELLVCLEKELGYHRERMPEAFAYRAGQCSSVLGPILEDTAQQLANRDGTAFAQLWNRAIKKHLPAKLLTEEELRAVESLSEVFCCTDTVMQKVFIQKYADRFQSMSREKERIFREKGMLYRKLAAAAGVFLVILLI